METIPDNYINIQIAILNTKIYICMGGERGGGTNNQFMFGIICHFLIKFRFCKYFLSIYNFKTRCNLRKIIFFGSYKYLLHTHMSTSLNKEMIYTKIFTVYLLTLFSLKITKLQWCIYIFWPWQLLKQNQICQALRKLPFHKNNNNRGSS